MNIMPHEPGSLGWILVWQQGRPVFSWDMHSCKRWPNQREGLEKQPGCDRTKTFFSGMQMYYIAMSPFGKKPLTYCTWRSSMFYLQRCCLKKSNIR
jgi:hypothetical protein